MQVTVSKQPKSVVRVTIELAPAEMKPYLDRAAETLSKTYKIEGFRPGKASLGIVQQKIGAGPVWEEAAEHAVRASFVQAVREHQLSTVGAPNISVHKLAPENPFVFHADVAIMPEVTLGDYRHLTSKPKPKPVTDEQVQQSLEQLRDMFAKDEPVESSAERGHKVEVDFTLTANGAPVEGGSSTNHPVVIGSNQFIPGFEDQLVGLKAGDQKEFTLPFPKNYGNKTLAGQTGTFKVTTKKVFRIDKPALDDAFAQQASRSKTLDELKSQIRENLRQEADHEADRDFERALIDELIGLTKFTELPELMVNAELDKMLAEMKEEVERRGMKYEDYLSSIKKNDAELRQEFMAHATRRVKSALLLRSIAKAERIEPSADEIRAEIDQALKTYASYPELKSQIESEDYRDFAKVMLTNRQVMAKIKAWANPSPTA